MKGNRLLAVHTDKPPAPDRLLKVVRCKCRTSCKTSRCTCSLMCGECRGLSCLNSIQMDSITGNEDND